MRPSNITSGFAFKTALWILLVSVPALVLAAYLLISNVTQNLEQELRAQILEEVALYREIYQQQGPQGLHQALSQIDKHLIKSQRLLSLYDRRGRNLLGANYIRVAPDFVGWRELQLLRGKSSDGTEREFLTHHSKHPQASVLVGRSLSLVRLVERRLAWACGIFIAVFSLFVLVLGLSLSRRSWNKLAALERGLARVAEGEMDTRLPVGKQRDQIDIIALQINSNLDRMQDLVSSIKNTSAAISHDLKTPLAHAQLALHSALDAIEQQRDPQAEIQAALDETNALNAMFDTILRISRIQTKNKDLSRFSRVEIASLFARVVEFLADAAAQQQQQIELDLEPDLSLWADAEMLQQALFNLLSNSIQHAGLGVTIRLSAERTENGIRLSVSDNGIGVDAALLEQITRPFMRVDSARSSEGNGLGLSLVEAIARYHGASLKLESCQPGLSISLLFAVS